MNNNYLEYQRSVAREFKAYQNRIRYMIGSAHWGEDGRYKEILLMNYLKRILPNGVSVGTGFVRTGKNISSQIDLIIYKNEIPLLFSEGDFIITTPENVIGIIEVKSKISSCNICEIIDKSNANGFLIGSDTKRAIFNGIFSYEHNNKVDSFVNNIKKMDYSEIIEKPSEIESVNAKSMQCVNHIALGSKTFIKYFSTGTTKLGNCTDSISAPYYAFYNMQDDLAIAYFISNLQEHILQSTLSIQKLETYDFSELYSFFYPIDGGKESRLKYVATMVKA